MPRKKTEKLIYTLDAETDPFLYGREPMPFAWGLSRPFAGSNKHLMFHHTWGKNCTLEMVEYLQQQDAGIVYAHNGGRFDIFYLLEHIGKIKRITNNRIVSCYMQCHNGWHEIRDSYKIFPAPLESYSKTKIDYNKFEAPVRQQHKAEIIEYLKDDCEKLHEICTEFVSTMGNFLTIGSCAVKALRKFHDVGDALTWDEDRDIRDRYFFGGRVQCFAQGFIQQPMYYVDVNSMYPFVMAEYWHPMGHPDSDNKRCISDKTFFVTVEGVNRGAFAQRMKTGGIDFTQQYGIFHTTIHEYNAAIELGLFDTHNIIRTVDFQERIKFTEYVQHYYALRQVATDSMKKHPEYSTEWYAQKLLKDLYKNLLNNSYGRFAINPDNQSEYCITDIGENLRGILDTGDDCDGDCDIIDDYGDRHYACGGWHECMFWGTSKTLWKRPSKYARVFHVGIGASITGAARSYLLRQIAKVKTPWYCDTDSLIFSGTLDGLEIHSSKLGALKVEHEGNELDACGKKLYAFGCDGINLKLASKGGKLSATDLRTIAGGGIVENYNAAPTHSLSGKTSFQKRTFRMT